jgi:hypothetical protein
MTFLCETHKVNLNDENSAYELEYLLNKYYEAKNRSIRYWFKRFFVEKEIVLILDATIHQAVLTKNIANNIPRIDSLTKEFIQKFII